MDSGAKYSPFFAIRPSGVDLEEQLAEPSCQRGLVFFLAAPSAGSERELLNGEDRRFLPRGILSGVFVVL